MGKKISNILKRKDIAAMGIGALIIFIAMVLVAGIAATVLIQTSSTLEMQVLRTGNQATDKIASGLVILGIEGYNASGDGAISLLAFEIRARAGSPDIDLSETVIEISDSTEKYVLEFGGTLTLSTATGGNVFNPAFYPAENISSQFYVIVLLDEDDSCTAANPIINTGDHVILAVNATIFNDEGLLNRKAVTGRVIPETGSSAIIDFRTPESFFVQILELQ